MRVPDELKECVCFLCVERDDRWSYQGTAFFVALPSELGSDGAFFFVVTAKHCVQAAQNAGADLYLRVNKHGGGFEFVKIATDWMYPDDEGVDAAFLPVLLPLDMFDYKCVSDRMFATDEVIKREGIGIGDRLVISGLFSLREGTERNIPIVRNGNIAAMPDEPMKDPDTGLLFGAYIAEVRSIGGLSGSPVFVFIDPGREHSGRINFGERRAYLLGLVKGHWDYKSTALDYGRSELSQVNMGMALVTPFQEVFKALQSSELKKERVRRERDSLKLGPSTFKS